MRTLIFSFLCVFLTSTTMTSQDLSPYIKVGESDKTIEEVSKSVVKSLEDANFTVLGQYNVSDKTSLKVIAFTKTFLKNSLIRVKDRGPLAAIMKVGLEAKDNKVIISYTNPDYILRAYLPKDFATQRAVVSEFSNSVKQVMSTLGSEMTPFGGTVKADKLAKYHYKIMMPYFTDPVTLNEFDSFEQGMAVINKNLKAKKGSTEEVYRLVYPDQKVAVFGIGMKDKEQGEAHFLPKIGESHLAALPYEIILQGKEVTMLHGKYRIALHWPDLTMGTFMKIMSTPGDIKDMLKGVCEE